MNKQRLIEILYLNVPMCLVILVNDDAFALSIKRKLGCLVPINVIYAIGSIIVSCEYRYAKNLGVNSVPYIVPVVLIDVGSAKIKSIVH